MFCAGLGDCFLLTIPQREGRPYVILIDCGVAKGSEGESALMQEVVRTIASLTHDPALNKGVIDLLVVTHEHYDHVCGFIHAQNELQKDLIVKQVWYAWTESRDDHLANELRKKHTKEKLALARAIAATRAMVTQPTAAGARGRLLKSLRGISTFFEPIGAKGNGKRIKVADAMAAAGKLQKSGEPATLRPGQVRRLPGTNKDSVAGNLQVFVLGPPHDAAKLRSINPHKKNPETYEKAPPPLQAVLSSLGMNWAWAAAMSGRTTARGVEATQSSSEIEQAMPFDSKWRRSLKRVKKDSFFRRHYFGADAQRKIDGDWLFSGAQQLALYMENYTNNTSLALAFELPRSKKVLLFAADAQVGSWLSWHEVDYQTDDGRSLKMTDLLANTVLYKVGHHGSHNATLREKGLEMMSHPQLVAMLPVEKIAVERLGYGEMPLLSLLRELEKRTKGRILQLDKKWPNGQPPGTWSGGLSKPVLATSTFRSGADGRALYMEYTVRDTSPP